MWACMVHGDGWCHQWCVAGCLRVLCRQATHAYLISPAGAMKMLNGLPLRCVRDGGGRACKHARQQAAGYGGQASRLPLVQADAAGLILMMMHTPSLLKNCARYAVLWHGHLLDRCTNCENTYLPRAADLRETLPAMLLVLVCGRGGEGLWVSRFRRFRFTVCRRRDARPGAPVRGAGIHVRGREAAAPMVALRQACTV